MKKQVGVFAIVTVISFIVLGFAPMGQAATNALMVQYILLALVGTIAVFLQRTGKLHLFWVCVPLFAIAAFYLMASIL